MSTKSQEIELVWNETFLEGDFNYLNGDLSLEQGIKSAVYISLFTDARVDDDIKLPDPLSTDRRGWWGDLIPDVEGDMIGSLLWLEERAKTEHGILPKIKQYVEDSLQWFIDDGVATDVGVVVERHGIVGNDRMAINVKVIMVDGHEVTLRLIDSLNEV